METIDIVLLAVTLLILAEVTYLLAKLPKTAVKTKDRAILVDTSVLMDGRIIALAGTGFIGGTLVVPRTVVGELQFLADNADADKRSRARRGLDVITELQAMPGVEVEILQDGSRAKDGVDEQLLLLAKQHHAVICTLDFNLNKVAVVEGIQVLNINSLAQSLRMSHLPGEQLHIEVVQKGQDAHQGVGYMPDGTMVVVEQASGQIGSTIEVEVTRSLQTAAGRMMFARKVERKMAAQVPKTRQTTTPLPKKSGEKNGKASSRRQHTPHATPTQARPQQPRKNIKRTASNREDALIELVNRQS